MEILKNRYKNIGNKRNKSSNKRKRKDLTNKQQKKQKKQKKHRVIWMNQKVTIFNQALIHG